MKCPKFIRHALRCKINAANRWREYDLIVSRWCKENGIILENEDCFGGIEGIVNPEESAERILEAITSKED